MRVLIDEDTISDLAASKKIFFRGRNLFNAKGRIGAIFYDTKKLLVFAKVSSFSGNVYDTFIQLSNNGTPEGAGCSCASFGIFKGPCKHVIALLLSLVKVEFPDKDIVHTEFDPNDPLKGTPILRQPILSFEVLSKITGPDEAPKSRRGRRPSTRAVNLTNSASENGLKISSIGNTSIFLQDETVADSKGEANLDFVKINPTNIANLVIESQADGTNVIKTKPRDPSGEVLLRELKAWNLREDNRNNTIFSLGQENDLVLMEINISFVPGNIYSTQLSLRVGIKDHMYVVPRIGEFLESLRRRDRIEFGSYFTWQRKQKITYKQVAFLEWLSANFQESLSRYQDNFTTAQLLSNQIELDSKSISLSVEQLRSLLELDIAENEEIFTYITLGNLEFPLIWRDTLPQNISLNLDCLNEENLSSAKADDNIKKRPNREEISKLSFSINGKKQEVFDLADMNNSSVYKNSIVLFPIRDIVLIDTVFYALRDLKSKLIAEILHVMSQEKDSILKLTSQESSYFLGMSQNILENEVFNISASIKEKIIKEELKTKIYLDYDGKQINLAVFYVYGEYSFRPGYAEEELITKTGDKNAILIRDFASEKRIIHDLEAMGFNEYRLKTDELGTVTRNKEGAYMAKQFYLAGESRIFNFINKHIETLNSYSQLFVGSEYRKITVIYPEKASINVDLSDSEAYLRLNIEIDDFEHEIVSKIVEAFLAGKNFVQISKYEFVDLQKPSEAESSWTDNIKDLKELVGTLESWEVKWEDNAFIIPKIRSLSLFASLEGKNITLDSKVEEINENWQRLSADLKNPAINAPNLPDGVNAELKRYQVEGFQWLSLLERYGLGGILADEMGLGKTLQMLTFLWSIYRHEGGKILIVAPTSLLYNWQKETERFIKDIPCTVITGNKQERDELYERYSNVDGIIVVSYGLVRQDRKELSKFQFNSIVLDEAQYIKNPMTKTSRAVKALNGKRRFALTGTPLENHIGELWSIFDFIMPGYLFNYSSFQDRFGILFKNNAQVNSLSRSELEDMSETELLAIADGNTVAVKHARESLRQLVSPFILRRLKQDVLQELPDKLTMNIPCPMTPEQQRVYREHINNARAQISEYDISEGKEQNRYRMNILGELTRLRQICCHPSLFVPAYHGGSGKLEVLEDLVDNLISGEHRILLFSQFTSMLEIIKERQEKLGREIFYIDGQVPSSKRLELVEKFNSGSGDLFLISLKAGGTGLNLTGADVVIHYDPWWNPAVEEQATDRAHRIGQEKHVQVFRLLTIGSIEEKIQEMQQAKQDLLDDIVSPGATFINRLNMEDIKELFMD